MKFGYSLPLCLVSAAQLLVLLFSILASNCQALAYGLSSSDAVTPLVHTRVSSLLDDGAGKVMLRHRCDPRVEINLRKELKNKAKVIRMLRRRLALKERNRTLRGKNFKVKPYHKNPYCVRYNSAKRNFARFSTKSSLTAIRMKVDDLEREVKYLQRWYEKQVREVAGMTHTRRERLSSEVKRIREIVFPNWNTSVLFSTSDLQDLPETLNSFRDGLIVIGSAVHQKSRSTTLNKTVAGKLKHLERSRSNHRNGIFPLLRDLTRLAASLNATLPQSHLCTRAGAELKDKIVALEAGSEVSLCGARMNEVGISCRSYGFFTFVRRFLVRLGQTVDRLSLTVPSSELLW